MLSVTLSTTFLYVFIILIFIVVCIGFLLIITRPTDDEVEYIIWNTVNTLPLMSNYTKEQIASLTSNFIINLRNKKMSEYVSIIQNKSNDDGKELIIIPKDEFYWDNKVEYCRDHEGTIDDIRMDQLSFPTKSQITLY